MVEMDRSVFFKASSIYNINPLHCCRMQKQALKPGELIGYASKVLSTFNVKDHSGDAHLRLFLQEKVLNIN